MCIVNVIYYLGNKNKWEGGVGINSIRIQIFGPNISSPWFVEFLDIKSMEKEGPL